MLPHYTDGDTSFFKSIRYRYNTKDFYWYRYQISIPILVRLNRHSSILAHYRFQNSFVANLFWNTNDFTLIQFHETYFHKKYTFFTFFCALIEIFLSFLRIHIEHKQRRLSIETSDTWEKYRYLLSTCNTWYQYQYLVSVLSSSLPH